MTEHTDRSIVALLSRLIHAENALPEFAGSGRARIAANAAHIAANSPDVVIADIDEILRLRDEVKRLKRESDWLAACCAHFCKNLSDGCACENCPARRPSCRQFASTENPSFWRDAASKAVEKTNRESV